MTHSPVINESSSIRLEPSRRVDRVRALRARLKVGGLAFAGVHNPLAALIAEEAGFEALWLSGFGHAAQAGVRDADELSWTELAEMIERVTEVSRAPLLVDGDAGFGDFNTARRALRRFAQRGAAGVCIEDKLFPKTNSFCGPQRLCDREEFAQKLRAIRATLHDHDLDLVLIARVEALIAGASMEEALLRADSYVEAGAEAILIHSKATSSEQVVEFQRRFTGAVPLLVVPTTYPLSPAERASFGGVIWANQLLRASVNAMQHAATRLKHDPADLTLAEGLSPMDEIFRLQRMEALFEDRRRYQAPPSTGAESSATASTRGDER